VTWRLIDGPFFAANQVLDTYTASPNSQTLFALTESPQTPPRSLPLAYYVWSSTDGGATWAQGGVTPGGRVDGIVAATIPGSDRATLYLLADNNQQQVDLHLYATTDGGHTWPRDLDLNTEDVGPSASPWLLGPLPDGGVAIYDNAGLGAPPPYGPPTTNFGAISEWRPEMSAPQTLTNFSNFRLLSQLAIQPAPHGGATIWMSGYAAGSGANVIEYTSAP
jgi:hypothetical protein